MRHLAAMLATERSIVVSNLMERLGEVAIASEYAEVTHRRDLLFRRFDFDTVQFGFHFHAVSIAERVRHPLSYPKDLEEPNRIRRSVTLACLGLHDAIDGGVRTHHVSHDNFLAPVRASVELHHYRHRCCFNFHAVSIAERVRHPLSYPKDFSNYFRQPGGDATDPPHF